MQPISNLPSVADCLSKREQFSVSLRKEKKKDLLKQRRAKIAIMNLSKSKFFAKKEDENFVMNEKLTIQDIFRALNYMISKDLPINHPNSFSLLDCLQIMKELLMLVQKREKIESADEILSKNMIQVTAIFFLCRTYDCEMDDTVIQLLTVTTDFLVLYSEFVQENKLNFRYDMPAILKEVIKTHFLSDDSGLKINELVANKNFEALKVRMELLEKLLNLANRQVELN